MTEIERLAELEKKHALHEAAVKSWQEAHEERMSFQMTAFSQRLETVEGTQMSMHQTMSGVKEGLDKIVDRLDREAAIKEAISGDRRKRKMDLKDWMQIFLGIIGAVAIILPVVKSMIN